MAVRTSPDTAPVTVQNRALLLALREPSTSPAFHHGYRRGAGTLHTIVGEPAKKRLLIGIGGLFCLASGIALTSFMRRPEYGAKPPTEDGQERVPYK